MGGPEKCWLIANAASGSNSGSALEQVCHALADTGFPVARRIAFPEEQVPTADELARAGISLLVTYAGDGSLRSILTALTGWSGRVLVLPGGTMNLLSKALHGDRPAMEIAAGLPHMRTVRRPCIRCSAGLAIIEAVAGPGAKWSDVRENLRDREIAEVASNTLEAAQASTGDSLVVLTDPEVGSREGYAGVRLSPFPDGLEIAGYRAQTAADYLKQGVALLRRDFRLGPHDELGRHARVSCTSIDGGPIELMLDGERVTGPSALAFSLAELDLDLLS